MFKHAVREMPSQYNEEGYQPLLDTPELGQLGYLPGVTPAKPQSHNPDWLVPAGIGAMALVGGAGLVGGIRNLGRSISKGMAKKPAAIAPVLEGGPWTLQRELAARGSTLLESPLAPGKPLGFAYTPEGEALRRQILGGAGRARTVRSSGQKPILLTQRKPPQQTNNPVIKTSSFLQTETLPLVRILYAIAEGR